MASSGRPVILVAVGDADSRTGVAAELDRRYSADYHVVAVDAASAVDEVAAISARRQTLALVLCDSAGTADADAFGAARQRFPDCRRGLLIDWGPGARRAPATPCSTSWREAASTTT